MANNDPFEVGAALRRIPIHTAADPRVDDRRLIDTSEPHKWMPEDFEDPDNPPPLPPMTEMSRALGAADIRRPTADEVMRYILENVAQGDEPLTNSNVRRRK